MTLPSYSLPSLFAAPAATSQISKLWPRWSGHLKQRRCEARLLGLLAAPFAILFGASGEQITKTKTNYQRWDGLTYNRCRLVALLHTGHTSARLCVILFKAPVNLFFGVTAGVSVSLLYQTDQFVLLAADLVRCLSLSAFRPQAAKQPASDGVGYEDA